MDGAMLLDFGAQRWYTGHLRVNDKPLILLTLLKLRGNPSLSATTGTQSLFAPSRLTSLTVPISKDRRALRRAPMHVGAG